MSRLFLIRIATDLRIRKLVWMPMMLSDGEKQIFDIFYKTGILCDACGERVGTGRKGEERLPPGYALCDEESLIEVVCEACRARYFPNLPVYDELEEAERV